MESGGCLDKDSVERVNQSAVVSVVGRADGSAVAR